ncbi:uncharacterized protein LOC62_02G003182 [Vanrija pseudolonga]|uniref:Uncharacterized protein n=1 Tax=Vanrija pseudolonga TaxID=143232 RepID=A0AAF0Y7U1_9TREE|nr:hypothetical protein LOC62_02G003182 [Vanrija pseudolonga]
MPPAATLPGKTIRQQAKAKGSGADRADLKKDVVKPLLMSPLTVGWPNIPNHLQVGVMAALSQLVPSSVADYHTDRARSSRAGKRARRTQKRADEAGAVVAEEAKKATGRGDVAMEDADLAEALQVAGPGTATAEPSVPTRCGPPTPDILTHFVIGLNETIKALEHSIDDLRFRSAILSDLLARKRSAQDDDLPRFLPTAPTDKVEPASPSTPSAPLSMVLVFNGSVSPQALIDPLPMYAATYNTLLRQNEKLAKSVRSRIPEGEKYIGAEGPEIRIVPLGSREAEGSALFGLRRVSVFAIKSSHPALDVLERLLPPSVLQAPRHAITLPYPTTSLKIFGDEPKDAEPKDGESAVPVAAKPKPKPKVQPSEVPTPAIYYAPVHLKGVLTEAPLDANARKQRRLTEVRRKRVETKEKRREAAAKLEQKLRAEFRAEGRTHPKIGRKERIAIKAGERAAKFAAKQEAKEKKAAEASNPQPKEKRAGEPLVQSKAKRAKAEAKAKAVDKARAAATTTAQ